MMLALVHEGFPILHGMPRRITIRYFQVNFCFTFHLMLVNMFDYYFYGVKNTRKDDLCLLDGFG